MKTKHVILLRHAQALDDVDNNAYLRFLDANIPLTSVGNQQVKDLAPLLSDYLGKSVQVFHNGLVRLDQTAKQLSDILSNCSWTFTTEALLNKQNRGEINMENRAQIESDRYEQGVLRYTFPGGESAESVVSRHCQFMKNILEIVKDPNSPDTFIIITSGFEMRICLMTLFDWSEEYFESLAYPQNCEFKVVEIKSDHTPVLLQEMRKHKRHQDPDFVKRVR